MTTYTNGTQFINGETAVTCDVLASIQRIWLERRPHINGAGAECCEGCGLARQIPWLLDLIDHLKAEVQPKEIRTEYVAWCHDEDPAAIRHSKDEFPTAEAADRWALSIYGRFGIVGHTLVRREHHIYPAGSRFASASTPWVPVAAEVAAPALPDWDDGTCGDCADGKCHGGDPDDCGCARHSASVTE